MSEDIYYKSRNGLKICATIEEPSPKKESIVVIVHGLTSGRKGVTETQTAEDLKERNINSIRMDLNGCGDSEGDFLEQKISNSVDDVLATFDIVKERGYNSIDLFGFSCGGLVAMAATLEYGNIRRLGLKSPASNLYSWSNAMGAQFLDDWKNKGYFIHHNKITGEDFKVGYGYYEESRDYIMKDKVHQISCPTLIIHGTADETIDYKYSIDLVPGFKDGTLILLNGADHGQDIDGDRAQSRQRFADWFEGKLDL